MLRIAVVLAKYLREPKETSSLRPKGSLELVGFIGVPDEISSFFKFQRKLNRRDSSSSTTSHSASEALRL